MGHGDVCERRTGDAPLQRCTGVDAAVTTLQRGVGGEGGGTTSVPKPGLTEATYHQQKSFLEDLQLKQISPQTELSTVCDFSSKNVLSRS